MGLQSSQRPAAPTPRCTEQAAADAGRAIAPRARSSARRRRAAAGCRAASYVRALEHSPLGAWGAPLERGRQPGPWPSSAGPTMWVGRSSITRRDPSTRPGGRPPAVPPPAADRVSIDRRRDCLQMRPGVAAVYGDDRAGQPIPGGELRRRRGGGLQLCARRERDAHHVRPTRLGRAPAEDAADRVVRLGLLAPAWPRTRAAAHGTPRGGSRSWTRVTAVTRPPAGPSRWPPSPPPPPTVTGHRRPTDTDSARAAVNLLLATLRYLRYFY